MANRYSIVKKKNTKLDLKYGVAEDNDNLTTYINDDVIDRVFPNQYDNSDNKSTYSKLSKSAVRPIK